MQTRRVLFGLLAAAGIGALAYTARLACLLHGEMQAVDAEVLSQGRTSEPADGGDAETAGPFTFAVVRNARHDDVLLARALERVGELGAAPVIVLDDAQPSGTAERWDVAAVAEAHGDERVVHLVREADPAGEDDALLACRLQTPTGFAFPSRGCLFVAVEAPEAGEADGTAADGAAAGELPEEFASVASGTSQTFRFVPGPSRDDPAGSNAGDTNEDDGAAAGDAATADMTFALDDTAPSIELVSVDAAGRTSSTREPVAATLTSGDVVRRLDTRLRRAVRTRTGLAVVLAACALAITALLRLALPAKPSRGLGAPGPVRPAREPEVAAA